MLSEPSYWPPECNCSKDAGDIAMDEQVSDVDMPCSSWVLKAKRTFMIA